MMARLFPHRRKAAPFLYPGEELVPSAGVDRKGTHVVLEGEVKQALETGRVRMLVTASLFALAFCGISVRLFDVMVLGAVDHPISHRARAVARTDVITHTRADIVDRNGLLLATNLPTVNLYADSQKLINPAEAADKLVAVLPHLNRHDVFNRLTSGRRFVYLDRNLTPRQQQSVNSEGIPGLFFENAERRAYLQGSLFSHVLGATDPDNNGIAGTELTFNEALRQNPSIPLRLTVDARVQHAVRHTLLRNMEKFSATAASAVIMDVRSGEIVSLVSLPDYQPENFGASDANARFNRVTLGVYEMGSIFKLLNTAMALESGQIRLQDSYDTINPLKVARFTIRDVHRENRRLNVAEILTRSSNIGSARMAMQLGTEFQKKFLGRLGILDAARIELPETGHPLYPQPWRDINTMTISFGHGIAVTPISMIRGLAPLVNGGYMVQPTLLPRDAGDPQPQKVLRTETSLALRKLMRTVITDGTARKAEVPGYMVGGKGGTAEKISASGGYNRKNNMNSFAGAFPMDDPRYALVVTLDEPKGLKSTWGFATSGWNVVPTAGEIIAEIGPILGIQPRVNGQPIEVRAMKAAQARVARTAVVEEEGIDVAR
ncbi:peptidoglycan D,D-transpeptidase FtsI family protein [Haematospirillum sp. H1815]|uniref:peptidoglycan D,D-transpeptidase FtsI family protein n=1 Tax=Haematospirillum sp. H1815 TaxID=2723108 RepID=UPI001FD72DCE|nr:penicillin-binding protein 2 [Haematospirillum sp. H1815]